MQLNFSGRVKFGSAVGVARSHYSALYPSSELWPIIFSHRNDFAGSTFFRGVGRAKIILVEGNATFQSKGLLLRTVKAIGATLISAPISTKNDGGGRNPEAHQTRLGN